MLVIKPKGKRLLENIGIDGKIYIKINLKYYLMVWTVFLWISVGSKNMVAKCCFLDKMTFLQGSSFPS
jgi:hypothetical protein